ncbi:MAG: glycosyltransferase family 2 protein [Acidobacteriota bacterium]
MNKPLVSVIVPTYNRAYCLGATIDSVLAQTYSTLELLVIDDGSSDQTRELVENQYGYDPRVRYVYQTNAGVSAARNHGFRLAQGDFVALIDSDDLWEPWKLELQVAAFDRLPQVGMIWTDMRAIDSQGAPISDHYLRKMYSAYDYYPTTDSLFPNSFSLKEILPHLPANLANQRVYFGDIYSPMIMGSLVHTSTVLIRRQRRQAGWIFSRRFSNAAKIMSSLCAPAGRNGWLPRRFINHLSSRPPGSDHRSSRQGNGDQFSENSSADPAGMMGIVSNYRRYDS